jgi:hypothetical protein
MQFTGEIGALQIALEPGTFASISYDQETVIMEAFLAQGTLDLGQEANVFFGAQPAHEAYAEDAIRNIALRG